MYLIQNILKAEIKITVFIRTKFEILEGKK